MKVLLRYVTKWAAQFSTSLRVDLL